MMRLAVVLVALAACATGPQAHAAPDPDTLLTFHMPRLYANGDTLSDGYRKWEIAYGHQSTVWRDSVNILGPEWGRDLANFPKWVADAQPVIFAHGYARPGELVTVRRPLVMSLHWPYWFFSRSWTSVPSGWSNPTRSFVSND